MRLAKTKTPGVYRRGNRYVVTFRDQRGVPRKRSAASLAEARHLKAALATDIRRGEYRPQSRITFAAYAEEWAASYQGRTYRGIRPETLLDYKADLERHAIPFLGHLHLTEIEPRNLKAFATHLTSKGLSPSTVRCILGPVRALLATAHEDGLLRYNPAAGLRLAQPNPHGHRAKRKALSEPELRQLLDTVPAEWRLFFEFLAHTGLRIGEAIALRWEDVDFEQRRIHVTRRLYRGRIDTPKSDYGLRTIPLAANLATALAAKRHGAPDDSPIFPSPTGNYLDPSNVRQRILKPAGAKAGVPWIGFHTFRHTCASTLFRHGLNAKQVQAWLGHHSAAFTLSTYVHLLPEDLPNPDFLDQITSQSGNTMATRPPENPPNVATLKPPQKPLFPGQTRTAEIARTPS